MGTYRVIELRPGSTKWELSVKAASREQAGEIAFVEKLVRSGSPQFLVCRVYWETAGGTNMTRLYSQQMRYHFANGDVSDDHKLS